MQVFSKVGDVKRIVMGLDKQQLTPCGFCFVMYYTRQDTEDCVKCVMSLRRIHDRDTRSCSCLSPPQLAWRSVVGRHTTLATPPAAAWAVVAAMARRVCVGEGRKIAMQGTAIANAVAGTSMG